MNDELKDIYALNDERMEQLNQRALRFAREECPVGACPIEPELIRCVDESVSLVARGTRVDTFIPVLAMKRVRECIAVGTCNLAGSQA